MRKLTEEEQLIYGMFVLSCYRSEGIYDHMGVNSYRDAQRYLIEKKIIKQEECYRK